MSIPTKPFDPNVAGDHDGVGESDRYRNGVVARSIVATLFAWVLMFSATMTATRADDWLGFRGDGTNAATSSPPESIIDDQGKPRPRWKTEIEGESVAGVVVVGDVVVATSSYGPVGNHIAITGLDLVNGHERWRQNFESTGRPYSHPTGANAAPTPVSDGRYIVSLFSSNDLVCLNREGEIVWYRGLTVDHPAIGNDLGLASSPAIADGVVTVLIENQGTPIALGIDVQSGRDLWKIDRDPESNWASPVAVRRGGDAGGMQFVMASRNEVIGIEPSTGEIAWTLDEPRSAVSSPTPAGDKLFLPGDDLLAVDLTSAAIPSELWRERSLATPNASPVVTDDRIYSLKGSVLIAADTDGQTIWKQRLGGLAGTWATPVIAKDRLFVFDQKGGGRVVVDRGEEAEIVEEVDLGNGVYGSPAVVDGKLLVRTRDAVWCF